MSYDLMVFEREKAPSKKEEFLKWYGEVTDWDMEKDYEDEK